MVAVKVLGGKRLVRPTLTAAEAPGCLPEGTVPGPDCGDW